jgi:uncharacterized membrane protein YphA (DoxX/SURF4 family)
LIEAFCKEKLGPLALRLAVGLFCAYHGYLKIMASGGTAWNPAWPVALQVLISWAEFSAGVAILLGFRCRLAASVILVLTAGMLLWAQGWKVLSVPLHNLELTLLLLLSGLALLFLGAGQLSLDARSGGKSARAR